MATTTNVDLVSKTENGCAICMNGWRFPIKMLDCGHSFCQWCLIGCRRQYRLVSSFYMPCPTCRTEVRARNVDEMPTNWALQQIVERLGLVNNDEDSMTASCDDTEECEDENVSRFTYAISDDADSLLGSNVITRMITMSVLSHVGLSDSNLDSVRSQMTSYSGSLVDDIDWTPTEVHDRSFAMPIVNRFQVLNSTTEEDDNDSAFNINVDLDDMDSNPTDRANTTDNASLSLDSPDGTPEEEEVISVTIRL